MTEIPVLGQPTESTGQTLKPPEAVRRIFPSPRPVELRFDERGMPIEMYRSGRWWPIDARGPERLSGQWWTQPFAYEDYRLVLLSGEVFWARRDAHRQQWLLMGWFD